MSDLFQSGYLSIFDGYPSPEAAKLIHTRATFLLDKFPYMNTFDHGKRVADYIHNRNPPKDKALTQFLDENYGLEMVTPTNDPQMFDLKPVEDIAVDILYTNWKGNTSTRKITPKRIWFGSTEYHQQPQWLMTAWDLEKEAWRDFAMKDIHELA